MYRLDVFEDNEWVRYSAHKNLENGEINGEVISKSRGCQARLIKDGQIVKDWGIYERGKI